MDFEWDGFALTILEKTLSSVIKTSYYKNLYNFDAYVFFQTWNKYLKFFSHDL